MGFVPGLRVGCKGNIEAVRQRPVGNSKRKIERIEQPEGKIRAGRNTLLRLPDPLPQLDDLSGLIWADRLPDRWTTGIIITNTNRKIIVNNNFIYD
jgi:hypothetical protein